MTKKQLASNHQTLGSIGGFRYTNGMWSLMNHFRLLRWFPQMKTKKEIQNKKIVLEHELVTHLAQNLMNEFKTNTYVRELSAGYGIADLVFAKNYDLNINKANRVPIDNYYALSLYLSMADDGLVTISEASRLIGVSNHIASASINRLAQQGYLTLEVGKTYRKVSDRTIEPLKLVAIEAKLSDWRHGVMQARRYKTFTDECYLALLSRYAKNVDFEMLEFHDIGLIVVDEITGKIEFKRKPLGHRPQHMSSQETSLFANELFLTNAVARI